MRVVMVAGLTHDKKADGYDAYLGFVWVDDDYKIKVYDIPSEPDRRAKLVVLLRKVVSDLENKTPVDTSVRPVGGCVDCGCA